MFIMLLAEVMPYDFWVNLLEKGGLPALAVGVIGTIFLVMQRGQQKQQTARDKQQADQYHELMEFNSELVDNLFEVATNSASAVTRLSERVGQCPLRDARTHIVVDTLEGEDGN